MVLHGLADNATLRRSILTLPLENVGTDELVAVAELLLQTLFFQGHQQEHPLLLKDEAGLPKRGRLSPCKSFGPSDGLRGSNPNLAVKMRPGQTRP